MRISAAPPPCCHSACWPDCEGDAQALRPGGAAAGCASPPARAICSIGKRDGAIRSACDSEGWHATPPRHQSLRLSWVYRHTLDRARERGKICLTRQKRITLSNDRVRRVSPLANSCSETAHQTDYHARPLHPGGDVTVPHSAWLLNVEASILQATRSGTSQSFSALSPDNYGICESGRRRPKRSALTRWRTWHRDPDTVIGVFQAGTETAPWLVIGLHGAWAVASCNEGTVSRTLHSCRSDWGWSIRARPKAAHRTCSAGAFDLRNVQR